MLACPGEHNLISFLKPSTRHDVAQVLERGLSDQDICEYTVGSQAGAGLGAALNPISAHVNDAATSLLFMMGSKATKKSQFVKVRRTTSLCS